MLRFAGSRINRLSVAQAPPLWDTFLMGGKKAVYLKNNYILKISKFSGEMEYADKVQFSAGLVSSL